MLSFHGNVFQALLLVVFVAAAAFTNNGGGVDCFSATATATHIWATRSSVLDKLSQNTQCHSSLVDARKRRRLSVSLAASLTDDTNTNIFHAYTGPIVFVGGSNKGKNDHVHRLAKMVLSKQRNTAGVVQTLDSSSDVSSINKNDGNDVIVLEVGDETAAAATAAEKLLKTMYSNDLLMLYINDNSNAKSLDDMLVQYTDYELCIRNEGSNDGDWDHIEWELLRLLSRAMLGSAIPGDTGTNTVNSAHLTMGENTFFLSLSCADITEIQPYVMSMCNDVDAMEYRTDLLSCRDSRFDLLHGLQLLRKYCRPHTVRVPALPVSLSGSVIEDSIPIVYTVRTQNQAGTYPDETKDDITQMFQLLAWGLRAGVEVLDVESAWDTALTKSLLDTAEQRYASQILGSHHVVPTPVSIEQAVGLFEQCALNGRAHAAKVVLSIDSDEHDRMAYEAALIATELAKADGAPVIPHISLILGETGQFSRIINLPFTPVTHESLPVAAAPGQLTASEIMATRILTQIFTTRRYAILGHNIAYSVSPQMHGAAFTATKLANSYVRCDMETIEEFIESDVFTSENFGGTSITIPHKQSIIPYVDVMSEEARAIGSVNTLIAKDEYEIGDDGEEKIERVIYGDNTDWKGIYNPLHRLLGAASPTEKEYGLIIGAGGTARAAAFVVAKKLGLTPLYSNRTPEKAKDLATTFGGSVVSSLENDEGDDVSLGSVLRKNNGKLRVVISTVPAASEFTLPQWIYDDTAPVIFDVNYKPYSTALLEQAEKNQCPVVRGSEMLWEQGVGQFELWTGRTAPYSVMKQVVLDNCQPTLLTNDDDEE